MGMPAVPPPSRFNFAAHLLGCNGGRAAKTAYIDDQQSLSYGELAQRVQRMAAALAGLGIRREEHDPRTASQLEYAAILSMGR